MRQRLEADLALPIADWCRTLGLTVYGEVPCYGRRVDMFALSDPPHPERSVAVELKLGLNERVIEQAEPLTAVVARVYCAVAHRPRRRTALLRRCRDAGIGVLMIDGLGVHEALPPGRAPLAPLGYGWSRVVAWCESAGPSDVAGVAAGRHASVAQASRP